ncbi:24568_t:CDS:2, partial [Dentiscutata erythropus]
WIYGKKRIRLAFEKVEALAKIHRYYTTHAKEEISYINRELTLEDVSDSEHVAEEEPNYNYDVDNLVDE